MQKNVANFFIGLDREEEEEPFWVPRFSRYRYSLDMVLIGVLIYYKLKLILIECLPKSARSTSDVGPAHCETGLGRGLPLGLIDESEQLSSAFEIYDKIYEPHFISSR
ncbi:uncharacterized protein DMAD_03431 [Drosophila madeirensis]|uniref:Uncharacterized protein n=1 Tax=Drosophila madeirensis TaxID=30013 RepID=A0AAU9GAG3_DROMD